ncbi:MAG: hypothetical protein ABIL62_14195 [Planctomycetota bacterium]
MSKLVSTTLNEKGILKHKTEAVEAGMVLSKLVSKLEAGSRMPDKIHESGFGQK